MNDPAPVNITGEKTVTHIVEHTVRWDYLVLGVAAIYLVSKLSRALSETEPGEIADAASVKIEEPRENNQVPGMGTER